MTNSKKEDRRDTITFDVVTFHVSDLFDLATALVRHKDFREIAAQPLILPKDESSVYLFDMSVDKFVFGLNFYLDEIGEDPIDQYDIEISGNIKAESGHDCDIVYVSNAAFGELIKRN